MAGTCVCVYVILLGVNKKKRETFLHQLYMSTNPVGISLFTVNILSLYNSLAIFLLFPHCTLHYLPPILLHCNPPVLFQILTHNSDCVPPTALSQDSEEGASLGKVWPTTAQWLWVIKVV